MTFTQNMREAFAKFGPILTVSFRGELHQKNANTNTHLHLSRFKKVYCTLPEGHFKCKIPTGSQELK